MPSGDPSRPLPGGAAATAAPEADRSQDRRPAGGRSWADSLPVWVAVVMLAAVLSFAPSLGNDWVSDDSSVILLHPAVRQAPLAGSLVAPFWPPGLSADKLYRPLTTFSYRVEVASTPDGTPDAARTHATNLLLHAAASVGVLLLAAAIGLPGATAGLAGVLFAVHPVHAEAVVTGYGRAELLAGLAGALLLGRCARVSPERRGRKELATTTFLFAVAVTAKEHGLLLWPAVLMLDLARYGRLTDPGRPSRVQWINEALPRAHVGFAAVAVVFLLVRWSVLGGAFRLPDAALRLWEDPLAGATGPTRGLTALRLLWLTARVLVDPGALCPLWSYPALAPATSWSADVLAGAALACAGAVAILLGLGRRAPWTGLALALVPLLWVVLHLPPAPHWIFAERWLYLPSVVIAVLVVTPLRRLPGLAAAALAIVGGTLLIPSTHAYAREFASDLVLARATVARQPNSFHGVRHLALTQLRLGHWTEAVASARDLERRFGPTPDSEWVILNGSLRLGDRAAAEGALAALRRRFPGGEPRALQVLARGVAALPAPGRPSVPPGGGR